MPPDSDSSFDSARAELFEALGHPNRIRILQSMQDQPMGFADLKKKVGIESSGHLAFHLGKLAGLVSLGTDGRYALTDDGREALRIVRIAKDRATGSLDGGARIEVRKVAFVGLIALLILVAAFAGIQQLRIAQLSNQPSGLVSLSGRSYWYSTVSLQGLPTDRNLSFVFHGVKFTLIPTGTEEIVLGNFTHLTIVANGMSNESSAKVGVVVYVTFPAYPSENVQVAFPDGSRELMRLTWSTYNNVTMTFYDAHQRFPWFSTHTEPQAALVEINGTITMYVSASK